ncbi:MAG: acyl transferase [Bacteroidetes bacterium]|nr:acyl transferase [Bacteroidota bacterium]MBL6943621.1 acyl transferase [Bacteroidales bacterium]
MPEIKSVENRIFNISSHDDFNETALELFHFQYKNNRVYRQFVNFLKTRVSQINHYSQIPTLPVEFFKNHRVTSGSFNPEMIFTSSGTSGMQSSKHYVKNVELYESAFTRTFELFFGSPEDYIIIALLPSYLERHGSSLVYMADKLIGLSSRAESGFYLHDYKELNSLLRSLKKQKQKVMLLGVTYALLDLAEQYPTHFPEMKLMETGGMKGRRKELVHDELHNILKNAFGVQQIYSEYGMTELLSQAYSIGEGIFSTPPWMKILIRDVNDPLSILPSGKTGGINIIDLANIYSCSFIATQDLGKIYSHDRFEILGRYDNSDVRGCNLMVG